MQRALRLFPFFMILAVSSCTQEEKQPAAAVAKPPAAAPRAPAQTEPVEKYVLYKGDQDEFTVEIPSDLNAIKVKQNPGPQGKWRTNEYRVDASRFIGGIMIRCQKFAGSGIPAKNVEPMLKDGLEIWRKGKTTVFEKKVEWAGTDAIRARMKQDHKGMTVYSDYLLAYLPANQTAYTAMFISSDLKILDEAGERFFSSFKHAGK
ncbi:MAG: hypothetical protein JXR96_04630 [Deltaproteobacteria bacterium]|nr:hypothetical protein [Deltaproteobacteria bacterium]